MSWQEHFSLSLCCGHVNMCQVSPSRRVQPSTLNFLMLGLYAAGRPAQMLVTSSCNAAKQKSSPKHMPHGPQKKSLLPSVRTCTISPAKAQDSATYDYVLNAWSCDEWYFATTDNCIPSRRLRRDSPFHSSPARKFGMSGGCESANMILLDCSPSQVARAKLIQIPRPRPQ